MSHPTVDTPQAGTTGRLWLQRMRKTALWLFKSTLIVSAFVALSIALGKLGKIHGKDLPESHFTDGYPVILGLLDSEVFMGVIFCVTIAIVVYVIYLFWQLHEVAVHKAKEMSSAHTQIVFALSLCGLFIDKTWWVLAIIIAFTRWDILGNGIVNILRKGTGRAPTTPVTGE